MVMEVTSVVTMEAMTVVAVTTVVMTVKVIVKMKTYIEKTILPAARSSWIGVKAL